MTRIPLQWSRAGPEGNQNVWGTIVSISDGRIYPITCEHGGSMWLCESCGEQILEKWDSAMPYSDAIKNPDLHDTVAEWPVQGRSIDE